MKKNIKVTVSLPADLVEQLQQASRDRNTTVTNVIRRGLRTEMFLNNEETQGTKILLKRENAPIVELVRRK